MKSIINSLPKSSANRLVACSFALLCGLFAAALGQAEDLKPSIAEALATGDTASAIDLLKQEIELDNAYHFNYHVLGLIEFQRARYAQARDYFETALDKKKNHYESLYYLGRCQLKLGEIDAAEAAMKKGREKAKDEQQPMFENGYGLVMMARENYQEAQSAFWQAMLGDSLNPEYHINLGDAYFYSGVPPMAISSYEKALNLDTAGLEVYYHWAEACLELKDYPCAIEKLRTVLQKDSTHAPSWMRAGEIYFKAGLSTRTRAERNERFKETIGSFKRYLELTGATPDSSNVAVFFGLAMAYMQLRGYEEAVEYFEAVLAIPYEPKEVYFNYGKSLWGIKNYQKSAEMLLKHIAWAEEQDQDYRSRVSDAELYLLLGHDYFYCKPDKDYHSAIKYYKKSLAEHPDQQRVLQNVAIAYHSLQSYAQAIEYYDKRIALGLDSLSTSILKNAAYCALNLANQAGDEDEADYEDEDPALAGVAPMVPADPVALYRKAVDYMGQYLAYQPDDARALLMVANTYLYQLNECNEGVKYFQQLLAVDPGNCDAKKSLGYAYFGGVCNKNYGKALGYLQDAYDCINASSGPCHDVDMVLWVAQCYHLRAAQRVESEGEGAGEDDYRNASRWYGKVLKCEPTHADAKKSRDEIQFEFSDNEL